MELDYDILLDRVRLDPLSHLGGYSPVLLYSYLMGYEFGQSFHGAAAVSGGFSMTQLGDWFSRRVLGGPHGIASFCVLKTNTEDQALELFFILRDSARSESEPASSTSEETMDADTHEPPMSLLSLLKTESFRKRPALYLGNDNWARGIWAMWSGYVWAEQDLSLPDSDDAKKFLGFQSWLEQRYRFAEGVTWGRLFEFLGMNSNERVLEQFYDHFDLFMEGGSPDAQSERTREWIAGRLAEVEEMRKRDKL